MPRLKAAVQARKETALESLRDALRTTGRLIRPRLGCPGYGAVRLALAHWRPDFDDVPEKERLALLRSVTQWDTERNSKAGPHARVDVERHASLTKELIEWLEAPEAARKAALSAQAVRRGPARTARKSCEVAAAVVSPLCQLETKREMLARLARRQAETSENDRALQKRHLKYAVVRRPSTHAAPCKQWRVMSEGNPPVPFVTVRGKNVLFDVGDRVLLSGQTGVVVARNLFGGGRDVLLDGENQSRTVLLSDLRAPAAAIKEQLTANVSRGLVVASPDGSNADHIPVTEVERAIELESSVGAALASQQRLLYASTGAVHTVVLGKLPDPSDDTELDQIERDLDRNATLIKTAGACLPDFDVSDACSWIVLTAEMASRFLGETVHRAGNVVLGPLQRDAFGTPLFTHGETVRYVQAYRGYCIGAPHRMTNTWQRIDRGGDVVSQQQAVLIADALLRARRRQLVDQSAEEAERRSKRQARAFASRAPPKPPKPPSKRRRV